MSYLAQDTSTAPRHTSPIVPATARGEATRRKLLDASEKEFGEKGFHAASVSSITTRADVGKGTFYLYFRSKEEVFTTLVREIGHALRRHTALAMNKVSPRLKAERAGLQAFFEFAHQHPGLSRLVQESQFVDEPVFREYYQRIAAGYAQGLKEAADRGELSQGDAETRAWALMGIGHFLGLKHCLWQNELPPQHVLDELMGLVSVGLAPPKPSLVKK
jgi:AcrR family transcriptional regulator